MLVINSGKQVVVVEDALRFLKRNAMLALVRTRLVLVPLECAHNVMHP